MNYGRQLQIGVFYNILFLNEVITLLSEKFNRIFSLKL